MWFLCVVLIFDLPMAQAVATRAAMTRNLIFLGWVLLWAVERAEARVIFNTAWVPPFILLCWVYLYYIFYRCILFRFKSNQCHTAHKHTGCHNDRLGFYLLSMLPSSALINWKRESKDLHQSLSWARKKKCIIIMAYVIFLSISTFLLRELRDHTTDGLDNAGITRSMSKQQYYCKRQWPSNESIVTSYLWMYQVYGYHHKHDNHQIRSIITIIM